MVNYFFNNKLGKWEIMNNRKVLSKTFLFVIYTLILLGVGISPFPKIVYPVGMFLGLFTFYGYFSNPFKETKWKDIGLFLFSICGSVVVSLLIWGACKLFQRPVCQVSSIRAQIFGNFAFPLFILFWLWVVQRLPIILRKK